MNTEYKKSTFSSRGVVAVAVFIAMCAVKALYKA